MIIQLEIPKEFAKDYVNNRFDDFFRRVYADIDNEGMCGNYEGETAQMMARAFKEYLQYKWGTVSIKGLSKALGRSENAIIVRAQRLGCGAHLAGDTRISLNQLMLAIYGKNMLGYTSDRLIRYGLPVKWHVVKKNRFRVIDIDAFWKWAEDNKSILDFSRFEKYGLGAEPDWVDVKRKADYKKLQLHGQHNAAWTKTEDDKLIQRPGSRAETFRRSHQAQDPRPWNQ